MFYLHEKIRRGGIYTIAEMSANHSGLLEKALEIVKAAHEAGADCLKIQTYTADTITIDCDKPCFRIHGGLWDGYNLHDLYKEAFTPWDWQPKIKAYCEELGMDFLSTPFDPTAVDFLADMGCEAYKIASFELIDIPLIEYAASLGKTMIISCGMGSREEIQEALAACRRVGNNDVILLKCCSEYPTNPKNLNLATLADMQSFGVPLGLSDHSMGYMADVLAVAQGACVIEKHLCLSRKEKSQDAAFSMEPMEFKAMVEAVQEAALMRGNVQYGPTESEAEEFKCRRSLFAVRDIPAGTMLTPKNVRSIRPYDGLPPKCLPDVLGKKAKVDIAFGTPLSWDIIE